MTEVTTAEYFGGCPQCGKNDGYTNIGRGHWFYCSAHNTKWWAGSNLFSTWRDETKEEQERQYNEIGLGEFTHAKPIYPPPDEPPQLEPRQKFPDRR
jgi:hypothetical protein